MVGNIIASAFSGNPSSINYVIFVAVFGMLTLFYLILVAWNDSFAMHPILPIVLDGLNVLFWFCAAVAMAALLGAHSCSNSVSTVASHFRSYLTLFQAYTHRNHITNGSKNTHQRCQEAQAVTAFLWFGWAAFTASLIFSFLDGRSGGVNMRGGIRKGGPSMSQV